MEITKDTLVIIEYTVRLKDGSYVKGENGPVSLNFIVGYDQVMPALERRLRGLTEGTETEFVIPAAEAFGEHDEQQVRTKKFADYPQGPSMEVGRWVIATNPDTDAKYSFFVKEKTDDAVVLDFNHPLAGKDLFYHVKVAHVRQALPEEIEYLRPCQNKEDEDEAASPQIASLK